MTSSLRLGGPLRKLPFALVALFAVVGVIAAFAYAINAWQVFGFAKHVWKLPLVLCFGAAVVADALSLAGLFATYLLRSAPKRVRAYAWFVFLGMTGLSIAAAESFAMWRRLPTEAAKNEAQPGAMIAAAAIVVALALAVHLLIVANRHARPAVVADLDGAEDAAGVPVDLIDGARRAGVYRAIGADPGPPLYIGVTDNLARRITDHKSLSGWFPQVVRWTFEPYDTMDEARTVEAMLIESEQPIHNSNHKRPRKPVVNRAPEGTVVQEVQPSIDVKALPKPQVTQRRVSPGGGRRAEAGAADRRNEFARRVVEGGERPADIAVEAGVTRRAVEQWAKAYRTRPFESPRQDDPPVQIVAASQINGKEPQLTGEVAS